MTSKNAVAESPGFGDFFSTLMQATSVEESESRDIHSDDWWGSENSDDVYDDRGNKNLSEVIKRIRDDGPVSEVKEHQRLRPPTRRAKVHTSSRVRKPFVQKYQAEIEKKKPKLPESIVEQSKPPVVNAKPKGEKKAATVTKINTGPATSAVANKGMLQRIFNLLQLFVVGGLIYGFTYLYSENQVLKLSIDGYESKLVDNENKQKDTEVLQTKVDSLKNRLDGVSKALAGVRADYHVIDEKIESGMNEEYEPEIVEVSDIRQDLIALRSEFERSQRLAAKDAGNLVVNKKKASVSVVSHSKQVDLWMVNLASLSSKPQAKMWAAKLENAGYKSMLEEKWINGSLFYRLSVSGFSTQDEAKSFVGIAKARYGFDGGWVKRS